MKPTRPSLVIIGHGSSSSGEAEEAVLAHAETLRLSNRFGSVLTHFLTRGAEIPELPEGEVFLLPFFMSGGFFVNIKIPDLFNLEGLELHEETRTLYQCEALGLDPELSDILQSMAQEICRDMGKPASEVEIVLVAHGSSKSSASSEAAELQVRALREKRRFGSVSNAYLEESPHIASVVKTLLEEGRNVVCLGLFAADGPHAVDDVPEEINRAIEKCRPEMGGSVHYAGVVGTRPEVVRLIQDSISRRARNLKK